MEWNLFSASPLDEIFLLCIIFQSLLCTRNIQNCILPVRDLFLSLTFGFSVFTVLELLQDAH